ncbi:MAG: helix-turn-helix domain-containing protein [Acidimicrobiales bacterium]
MLLLAVDGPFLRQERIVRGWTVEQFAGAVGISRQYLTDIEVGRRLLKRRPDLIRKMADVLGVPVTKLYRNGVV